MRWELRLSRWRKWIWCNVSLLCDNSVDILMTGSAVARRIKLRNDLFEQQLPIAEHGYSALIEVKKGENAGKLLFDTGVSKQGILYNMDAMEVDARDVQAISFKSWASRPRDGPAGAGGAAGQDRDAANLTPGCILAEEIGATERGGVANARHPTKRI